MQFKSFMIPASGNEQSEEALNLFLRGHRIVSVRHEFVQGETPAWCILVEFLPPENGTAPASRPGKVDYMKVLPPEEFAVFSRLREMRKELAQKDNMPPFVVFTDEQLAAIVKKRPVDTASLAAIPGVAAAKAEKYGPAVFAVLNGNEA